MALSEIDTREMDTDKRRERLSYLFIAFAAFTFFSYAFLPIQEAVRATVGNAVFVILGYAAGVNSFWFSSSPAAKKPTDNSTNTVNVADNIQQPQTDVKP